MLHIQYKNVNYIIMFCSNEDLQNYLSYFAIHKLSVPFIQISFQQTLPWKRNSIKRKSRDVFCAR